MQIIFRVHFRIFYIQRKVPGIHPTHDLHNFGLEGLTIKNRTTSVGTLVPNSASVSANHKSDGDLVENFSNF